MEHARRRGLQQTLTLGVVTALHGALIWSLLGSFPSGNPERRTPPSVMVMVIPASAPLRIRAELPPARRISGNLVSALPPLALGELPMSAMPASPVGAGGAGVDWAAEARRALHAYEIRGSRPPIHTSASGESEDEWARQLSHHAGDQVRMPNGDWIIWISADCYQVAKAGSALYTSGGPAPQAFCVDRSRPPAP